MVEWWWIAQGFNSLQHDFKEMLCDRAKDQPWDLNTIMDNLQQGDSLGECPLET